MTNSSGRSRYEKRRTAMRFLAVILALSMIITSVSYVVYMFAMNDIDGAPVVYAESEYLPESTARLENLKNVIDFIAKNYKDEVDVNKLVSAAYEGVFDTLDDWSEYYEKGETAYTPGDSGTYVGVGVTITLLSDGRCYITEVNKRGPAYRQGIREDSYIISVDGIPTENLGLSDISSKLRGVSGSKVTVVVEKDGIQLEYTIVRELITTATVEFKMLDNKIGYIDISEFAAETHSEFREAREVLLDEGMEGLIIDLRGNGGGYVEIAIDIADQILDKGYIVHYENKGTVFESYEAEPDDIKDVPIMILTDGGTASASELLTAALKENGAAMTVGLNTYGKGIAQGYADAGAENGDYLKLSVLYFLTPNKTNIHGVGIGPDYYAFGSGQYNADSRAALSKMITPMNEGKKYAAGEYGYNVFAAQQRLQVMGFDVELTACLDEKTQKALMEIQRAAGGYAYGGLDFFTIKALDKYYQQYISDTDYTLNRAVELLKK